MKRRINITIDDWLFNLAKNNKIKISSVVNENLLYWINREIRKSKLNYTQVEFNELQKIANTKWTD